MERGIGRENYGTNIFVKLVGSNDDSNRLCYEGLIEKAFIDLVSYTLFLFF
jgi:hypothetical protein